MGNSGLCCFSSIKFALLMFQNYIRSYYISKFYLLCAGKFFFRIEWWRWGRISDIRHFACWTYLCHSHEYRCGNCRYHVVHPLIDLNHQRGDHFHHVHHMFDLINRFRVRVEHLSECCMKLVHLWNMRRKMLNKEKINININ